MRRLLAVLLIALFGLLAVSPAFASDPDSNLPACCRRAGKHHCALASTSGAASGPALQSGGRCPYFPGSVVTTSPDAIAAVASRVLFAPAPRHAAVRYASQTSAIFSPDRSHQKRGPPSFLPFA